MAILKDLIVHGSSRFLNKIYASEIQTPLIEAEAGVFKKLKADDATIVGLLDVQGQMHTNSWTNSNIATIDGSFYITPTLSSSSGTVSFNSATAATFTGTYSAVSSLYVGNNTASTVQWTSGSKILITGEVQVNGEWTPLGTLLGTLNSTNPTTSMPIVSITDNRNNPSAILADIYSLKGNTSLSYRNLKVSLYQRADNSEYYPLGIFMTALGQNGKTFLDIYGGVNALTTSYGGYADPNVRIGNLSGLPAIITAAGNFTPVGWGIYTTNGYFSGTIVSNTGVIGGWKLGASSLYNGTTGLNNTTAGIYLGTDGIRNYKDANTYVNITEGVITAKGVNLTGEITATSGTIAGWTIKQSYLITGNNTGPGANILMLNGNGTTGSYTIAGTASTGWMITAGTTFGINKNGGVYATSGKIGGFEIGTTYIKNGKTSYNETTNDGVYLGTDGIGLGKGNFYVTKSGALYANNANISGEITATTGSISGGIITSGIDAGNITVGTLNADRIGANSIDASKINVSSISIGNLNGASNYAQKTDVTQAIDNIEVGGRNLLKYNVKNYGIAVSKISARSNCRGMYFACEGNQTYTISRKQVEGNRFWIATTTEEPVDGLDCDTIFDEDDSILKYTFTTSSTAKYVFIYLSNESDVINNGNIKAEKGNKATDWTPAPEDTQESINNVSTVANTALGQSSWYATCPTLGGTTEKVATITPATTAFTLTAGATVNVKFDAKNTGAVGSITLNVNETGAKNIKYINNNAISNIPDTDYIAAGRTYQFVYDGTYWVIQNLNYNTNTNTIGTLGATKLVAGTNVSNASATTVYRYTLIMKKTIGNSPTWVSLVTSSTTATSKTRYTGGLYPDKIFYMSSNVSSSPYGYSTGASTGDSYAALGFDLRYSTNCGSTLVIGKPVYLVGEINFLDGLFYLDSTWWTQTEPTIEDGKTYIYLGNAYSTTNVYLVEKNPLMRYYRGAFRTEEQIAGMTATSYITYVDANNGVKIHNYDNMADYIQINSDAISMYRRDTQQPQISIETLRIQSDNIRIGKIGTGKRNVFITDNNVQIRNNTTVLASYGDSIQIGQISYPHITLDTTTFSAYNNETDIYFTLGNGATEGQLNYIVGDYKYNCTLSYGIDSITSIKINGTSLAGDKYSFQVGAKILAIYEKVIQGDSIVISYNYSTINTETGSQTITSTSQTLSVASQSISFSTGNESITITSVTINDVATNNYTYSNNNITFTDSYMPNTGDEVIVNYITANVSPYFIFGDRLTNSQYGSGSVTFGKNLSVSGLRSFAIGDSNKISGQDSFSCGVNNQISGYAAGALGSYNKVFNTCGFTIGVNNTVNSKYSLAAGNYSVANAESSIALGVAVKTSEKSSLACGHYNIPNGNLFSIGCGTSSGLQNAFAIDTSGNAYLKGNLSALVDGKTPIPMFKTKTYSWTLSVSANTAADPVMQNIRITNYIPISVLGMYLQNNSGNAAAWRGCHVQNWWINPYGHNFYYRVVNNNSNNATLLMNVIVLYIASSAVSNSKLTIINN